MSKEMSVFFGNSIQLPAHLQEWKPPVPMPIFESVNRLSIKGKSFHAIVDGNDVKLTSATRAGYLEVVIVAMYKSGSRRYFEGGYDEASTSRPDCVSPDGNRPSAELSPSMQCDTCGACPMNQPDDNGNKPCSFFYRTVIMPVVKGKLFSKPLRFDANGTSFMHEDTTVEIDDNQFPTFGLKKYSGMITGNGYHVSFFHTYICFDDDSSVPVVTFTPVPQVFTSEDELQVISDAEKIITELCGFGVDKADANDSSDGEEAPPPPPKTTKAKNTKAKPKNTKPKTAPKPKPEPEPEPELIEEEEEELEDSPLPDTELENAGSDEDDELVDMLLG
jgi:hypothetical protein